MTETDNKAKSIRYNVQGMDCPSCSVKIENSLKRVPGTVSTQVNVGSGIVTVSGDFDEDAAAKAISRLGFDVSLEKPNAADKNDDTLSEASGSWWQTPKSRLVIVSAMLVALAFIADIWFPFLGQWPFVIATIVALYPVTRHALAAARTGSVFTIEMLMSIAAIGALTINAAEEAAVVVLLFAVGEALEGVASGRARKSISALGELTPKTAILINGESKTEVAIENLIPGQRVLVRPGDRIPCDGEIREGISEIDEAPVTGESTPIAKTVGNKVFAGTINITGLMTIEVTHTASDNTIARIIRLVENAQSTKAPVQRFIDKFARIYMPAVVGIALLIAMVPPVFLDGSWNTWTYRALALLLVACPCALVISTPAAIASGMSAGARRGLLIKGGIVLELLGGLKTVCFDKTGTLTEGKPRITDIKGFSTSDEEVLRLIAALENGSNHPIAKAVLAYASARGIIPPTARDVKAIVGKGLSGNLEGRNLLLLSPRAANAEGELPEEARKLIDAVETDGKTAAILMQDGKALGLFAVRDEPRNDAREGLRELSRLGIKSIMLTGDNRRTANAVAADLGIEARSELLPEDKAEIIRQLEISGQGPVGKVGDGINDAPALAAASVGIAMGGGTDIALETADAALLTNSVMGVADLVKLSRATMNNIHMNIILALGSKAIFLVTTILGFTGMWIAVMADTGATVLVTANAMRLLHWQASKA